MCCRLLLASLTLVLVVGVLPKITTAVPVQGGVLNIEKPNTTCVKFDGSNSASEPFIPHYCSRFGNRTTAFFPNPRGHKTPEEAATEFAHFIPLLQSGCNDKLGTLLCFIYFPFCTEDQPGPDFRIYPCKELCEEVTHENSTCTNLVRMGNGTWNHALQCDLPIYKNSSDQCINGVAPPYSNDVDECKEGTHDCDVNAECTNTPSSYTCSCKDGYSGDGKTCTEVCTEEKCKECDYRQNANSKTFQRNGYCFAAKVTLNGNTTIDCRHAYNVSVIEQYYLTTPFNTTISTKAPSLGNSALILTSSSHCTQCPKLEPKKTYLIAGSYSKSEHGKIEWELNGTSDNALVSEWLDKYDRKLERWIQISNSQRGSFVQQCEKVSELVSAGQWQ